MIILETKMIIAAMKGKAITDFMLACDDRRYQAWWPGIHLQFHTLKRRPGHVGNLVFMDEYVGKRRLRMKGRVREAFPGKRLVWQFQAGIRLPARLILELEECSEGLRLTHRLEAGFWGPGRIFDPLLRLYLTGDFARAMEEHARYEFPKLAEILSSGGFPAGPDR